MVGLQDLHCHLDLYPDLEEQIQSRERNGVRTLTVTTTPKAWPRNKQLTQGLQFVRAALGLHPELVAGAPGELDIWEKYLHEAEYIGEVGLDGRRDNKRSLPKQIEVFTHILKCCDRFKKRILSIHSAGAVKDVLELLESNIHHSEAHVILHWFTGTKSEAERAVQNGYYFSVNQRMLTAKKWKELECVIPLQRLLVETDAPFINKKYVGQEELLIKDSMALIADSFSMDSKGLGKILNRNFSRLFTPSPNNFT
jgi:TatD DNase family protein